MSTGQRISARDYKNGGRRRGMAAGGLVPFCMGLAVGLGAAVVVYVIDHRVAAADAEIAEQQPKKKQSAENSVTDADESAQEYDFYDMLSKYEVVLPEERNVRRDQTVAPITEAGSYMIQAGSFDREDVAVRRQQVLGKLGIQSAVQRVAVDADVKHRVRIGPIKDLARLNEIRGQLRTADIDVLLIRLPD